MKNKKFLALSQEKRQKNLAHILRVKTDGLLKVKEEVAILCAATHRRQFTISVFNDINVFKDAVDEIDESKDEIIFGESAIEKLKEAEAVIDTGIAVIANRTNGSGVSSDRLFIYIPQTRRCKGICVREKIICEHLESRYEDVFCCDLNLVRA